jgi:hypothetical protein
VAATRLRSIRQHGSAFDARFHEASPLFWPLAGAARAFDAEADWPDVSTYARAFEGDPLVRFEAMRPPPRRARRVGPIDRDAL